MKVFYSDGRLLGKGGSLRLIELDDHWHVAGEGYLCEVESYQEGVDLIEKMRSQAKSQGVDIEQPREDAPLS